MKKYLLNLLLILLLLIPTGAWGATYYGCATGVDIAADNTFCTTPTGSCTGTTAVSGATAIASGNILYANGCAEITTDNGFNIGTGTISTADGDDAGDAVAGGAFTFTTANDGAKTITANITAGSTDCLAIDGSGTGTVLTIVGDITGGGSTNADGVYDTHTGGNVVVTGDITAGSATSAHGYRRNGATGGVAVTGAIAGSGAAAYGWHNETGSSTINGNCTGGSMAGFAACNNSSSAGLLTVNGNCIAGSTTCPGCHSGGAGGITVTGNIVGTATYMGATGKINWSPADTTPPSNYIKIWTGGTDFYYMTANPEPAITDVKSGVTYGWDGSSVYTGTLSTSSGGGAWGF
jgi:hypothetical protein